MAQFHFVEDYEKLIAHMIATHPIDEAMALAVGGGPYEIFGQMEADILKAAGLAEGMRVVDLGCGSGRLASVLHQRGKFSYVGIDIIQPLLDYAKKKPEIVAESMKEFSKDRYGVDVLKVEVPVNMKYVEGAKAYGGQKAYSRTEARGLFLKAATATTKPFIYLSAGVSNAEFTEALELAAESGVKFNGVLCGRATWKEGIPIYARQGASAFRDWLESEGVKNINNVNDRLKAATSWYPVYGVEPAMVGA